MSRNKQIIQTAFVGVVANFLMAIIKFIVGALANSVSIITDAVNNLTDTMSSFIIILGTRLSAKRPDKKHPFGYGRIEYLSSLIIGMLILYAGITSILNSVHRIIHPEKNDYSTAMLIIISIAVVIRFIVGRYTKKKGQELDSEPLKASGEENLHDALMSIATLVAALVYMKFGVSIEAWVAALIGLLIIKTGIETLFNTAGSILGRSSDLELAVAVKESIESFPEVEGVYDIVIHSYGAEQHYGSAHIEVPDIFKVGWIDNLERAITRKVKEDTGVEMLGLSIYAINTRTKVVVEAREAIQRIIEETRGAKRMHGFYIDPVDKSINFDAVISFKVKDIDELHDELVNKVREIYPDYEIIIKIIHDFTESE